MCLPRSHNRDNQSFTVHVSGGPREDGEDVGLRLPKGQRAENFTIKGSEIWTSRLWEKPCYLIRVQIALRFGCQSQQNKETIIFYCLLLA